MIADFMETPPDPDAVPAHREWWDPNVELVPVTVTLTRWEMRKVLSAVRKRRRYTVKRGRTASILDANGTANPDAVEGAALWRAEVAFDAALGAREARP